MAVRKYSPDEITALIVRRRWLLLVPFAIGVALAPVLARYAPERYRSEALILVIPQQVPDEYVRPTVNESVAGRLPALTEQILSRSRLEQIIQEMDLYPAERARWVMEDVVERMRGDVNTEVVGGREINAFRVSYESDSPERARRVTERLSSLYIDRNQEDRANQANQTSDFLATQLTLAKQRLVEQEKKLEDYRRANAGQLPSQLQGNLQTIQSTNLQLQAINEAANRAQERRLLLERQMADTMAVPLTQPAPVAVGPTGETPIMPSAARQLEAAKARLTFMLQRNTPDHPDVVALNRLIEDLTVRAQAEADGEAEGVTRPATPEEAAREKRLRELKAQLDVLDLQLSANRAEEARLKQTIVEYQTKVDAVPTRESELVELTRDYSTMQAAYASLLMKQQDSVIAANLEVRRIGEQFQIVDPASRPERPYNQSQRLAVMGSGAAAGLLLGVLIVGLLEYRDSSFRSAEEVVSALELPVLASIPVMESDRERRVARRRGLMKDAAGTVVLVGAVLVLVVWRLQS
jgi:polysaccharide chain length determinant protein (PEP-CTERM system associated)